jgi:hypothetical protein
MGVGADLLNDILERVTDRNVSIRERYFSNILNRLGFNESIRQAFTIQLEEYLSSTPNQSIDSFLNFVNVTPGLAHRREDFLRIGKIAIAFHVLGYEGGCIGSAAFQQTSWLDILNDFIGKGEEIKIITFNYDRLVEEFLYRRRGNSIIEFCNTSVTHIYNHIAPLAWQDTSKFVMFGHPNNDARLLDEYRDTPILMYENRNAGNPSRDRARNWIRQAETIFFMGYSFDQYNNESLSLPGMEGKRFVIHLSRQTRYPFH